MKYFIFQFFPHTLTTLHNCHIQNELRGQIEGPNIFFKSTQVLMKEVMH
jgi:hypothetical protein